MQRGAAAAGEDLAVDEVGSFTTPKDTKITKIAKIAIKDLA